MKLLIALAVAIAATSAPAASHDHHHPEKKEAPTKLALNGGKKWDTDQPLRMGMDKIRELLDGAMPAMHDGKFSDSDFRSLAAASNSEVQAIFGACKLKPDADAMLHLVLTRLSNGITQMKSGKNLHLRHEGAMEVAAALQQYNRFFQHPGWKGLQH